jgi:hypothetical protein
MASLTASSSAIHPEVCPRIAGTEASDKRGT